MPDLFKDVKNALQYGRDGIKFDIVVYGLRIRDAKLKKEKKRFREM